MNTHSFQESQRTTAQQGRLAVAFTCMLLFSAFQSTAGMLPTPSITGLCDKAVLIVEGDHIGNGQVKVLKIYKGVEQVGTNSEIVVAGLEKCSKRVRNGGETLQTDHVVLFMDSQLQPLYLFGEGSGGVFWLSDDACYRYFQPMNPGGYALAKLQTTPGDLKREIEVSLEIAKEWETVKALKEPKAMAERMTIYLRQATWPVGYNGEFYTEMRERMPKLGADAVSPVVDVLRAGMKGGEDLNLPVLILYSIGKPAQPAVPVLLELLSNPGKTSRYYICSALKTAADKSAIPFVRPMLKVDDMQTAVEAAEALGAMGDKESFDSIAALLPKLKPVRSSMDVLRMNDLLTVLEKMNGQSAEPILNRYFADPAWAELLKDFKSSIYHSSN